MDKLYKQAITGSLIFLAVVLTLYAFLDAQNRNLPPLESHIIEGCRNLVRESADVFVEVARDNLKPDNPDQAPRLQELQNRLMEIEDEMHALDCYKTQERWTYGSFKQEMTEYDSYIAELNRQNAEK